jgi:hypothetical protein
MDFGFGFALTVYFEVTGWSTGASGSSLLILLFKFEVHIQTVLSGRADLANKLRLFWSISGLSDCSHVG